MTDLTLRGRVIVDASQMLCDLIGCTRTQLLQPGALRRLIPQHEIARLNQTGMHQIHMLHTSGRSIPVTVSIERKRGRVLLDIEQVHE